MSSGLSREEALLACAIYRDRCGGGVGWVAALDTARGCIQSAPPEIKAALTGSAGTGGGEGEKAETAYSEPPMCAKCFCEDAVNIGDSGRVYGLRIGDFRELKHRGDKHDCTPMEYVQRLESRLAAAEKEKAELRGQVETWIAAHGEQWNRANRATAEASRLRAEPGVVGVLANDEEGVTLPCPVEIRCPNCAAAQQDAKDAMSMICQAQREKAAAEKRAEEAEGRLRMRGGWIEEKYHLRTVAELAQERDALKAELDKAKARLDELDRFDVLGMTGRLNTALSERDSALARVKELDEVMKNIVLSLSHVKTTIRAADGAQP